MTLAIAQTTLENLKSYLNTREPVVQALVDSHTYAKASDEYAKMITHEKFTNMLNKLNNKDSIPLKLLGATLVALGVALIAAAFIFAPAIITAPAVGVGLIYASAAAAVSSASLIGFGGSLFNKQTERMKLASALRPLDEKDLEEAHYAPIPSPSV